MGNAAGQRRFSGQRLQFSRFPGVDARVDRPFPVTLIAVFQFAKAGFLLMVAVAARFVPEALHSVPGLPALLYFAAHGRDTRGPLLPFVTFYVGLIGLGLWRLWGWARRSLIFSSALMVALWAYRFTSDLNAGVQTSMKPLDEQMVLFLVFIDVVTVMYLAFYDGVPRAFEEVRF